MKSLLSSPARLADRDAIEDLKVLFCAHGALGFRKPTSHRTLSEWERLRLVPLVFGLMPRRAFERGNSDIPIKPSIAQHLDALGIAADPMLVDVIKSVCDQFYGTRTTQRKFSIGDIRAIRYRYARLMDGQNSRCALCGAPFEGDCLPTLDHVIPFRLVGDVPDGMQAGTQGRHTARGKEISHRPCARRSSHSLL
jgi:hypothetical protein